MATQTKPQTILFLSGAHPSFKMIRQSQGDIFLPNGNVANDPSKPEIAYQFKNGQLTLREGQDMLPDGIDPETGETVEQDAISWIRQQPDYGPVVYEVEPTAPPTGEVLALVARAAAAGDVDELVRLGDEEHESWGRPEVLEVIKDALARIEASVGGSEE